MKKTDFSKLKYFTYDEVDYKGRKIWQRPGVLANTDFKTVEALDKIREYMGDPVVLHCAYDPAGHSSKSMHYVQIGTAIDFHFDNRAPFYQQVLALETALEKIGIAKTCGLGIYPDWKNQGFHLDLRGKWARWGARNIGGTQKYCLYQEVLEYARGL